VSDAAIGRRSLEKAMNILKLAGDAGMLVVLDGKIGCTEYRSVHGTFDAFQRFVQALESALTNDHESDGHERRRDLCAESSSS
jgi:hypothetical protein